MTFGHRWAGARISFKIHMDNGVDGKVLIQTQCRVLCDKTRHASPGSCLCRRSGRHMSSTDSTESKNRGEERRHRHPKTTLIGR